MQAVVGRCFVVALVAFILAVVPAQAVMVPGTRVQLEPPAGFVPSTVFPGFEHVESGASIMVTEVPAPASGILEALTGENLATKQMTLVSQEAMRFGNFDGQLVAVTQPAYGDTFVKWLGGFGDDEVTVIVVASCPEGVAATWSERLRLAVLSTRLEPAATPGLFDGLDFRVDNGPSLEVSERVSNMVLLSRGGKPGPLGAHEPLLIVGSSLAPAAVADLETFAYLRIRQIEQVEHLEQFAGKSVEVDGHPGYELTARAVDLKSGVPVAVYLVVVPRGDLYLIVVGTVGVEDVEGTFAEFRAIVATIAFGGTAGE